MVPPAGVKDLPLVFDARALVKGDYQSTLIISSNDPYRPEVYIPVRLSVSGFPVISIPDTLLSFSGWSLETQDLNS